MTIDQFNALRAALASDVGDDYANDIKRRSKIGSEQYKKDVAARQKAGGVGLDSDGPAKANPVALARTGTWAAQAVLYGITAAFGQGVQLGNAAGALASGLSHAFTGAAAGFIHAGEGLLSLVLSPFGASGQAVGKLAAGLGQSLVSALSAAGAVASAGVKIGVGLTAGILAGLASAGSAGIGGVIGGILGSVLPGGGTVVGAFIGATVGSAVAGAVLSSLTGIVGSVSSAMGQAFSAIGDAFGKVAGSIGDALGSIKSVLSDLIETGVKLGQTALGVQRNSGMSGQASSDAVGLSQVLTGGAGAFNGVFGNVAMMTPYMKARDTAYGVKAGNSFVDNLPGLFKRYQAFGDGPAGALQRRIMLSVVAPGAQDTIGGLFSLGGDVVQKAVQTAKAVALTPAENKQNAMLGFDLNAVQAQLDRLKTKLLSDLMPALNGILGVFTKWFTGHESQIVSGLEVFGKWIYVKLPTYLQAGANAFFELGKSLASSLPAVAEFGKTVYSTFALVINGLKAGFGAMLTTAGLVVTALAGLGGPLAGIFGNAGMSLTKSGLALGTSPGMDPHGADALLNRLGAAEPGLTKSLQGAQDGANGFFGQAFGTEAERAADWKKFGPGSPGSAGRSTVDINLKADITTHPDEDSHARFVQHVGDQTIKRLVRADQRS